MQMKKLQLASQTVAYYESGGDGQPVLLIHGNSASGLTFRHQLESELGNTHRLIALDLPGHGDSDPAPDSSAYGMPGYAAVVAEAAEALGMADAVLVGWSLGGHIALEAHNYLPQAKGFVIYGTPPLAFPPDMANAFLPNPAVNVGFTAVVSEADALTYATSFFAPNAEIDPAPFIADILRTDGNARVGLAASIKPDGYQDEVAIVANLTRPLAILHGAEEQLVSEPYISSLTMPTLWRGRVQIIPGAGHAPHWEQPQAFNNLLTNFLAEIG
ncbi:MAG: alpha/beta hydrolase [Ardenticatenaceae bacterium]|nr:alpha/beta hydrolase [Anaerolineales bacterium]MCB8922345.1 alpha/beta hydrolase [Ardenticatenaceae bacterium]MCB9005607.1 alpha/beta hydrolase [Ardenticatenaceae bacterium]